MPQEATLSTELLEHLTWQQSNQVPSAQRDPSGLVQVAFIPEAIAAEPVMPKFDNPKTGTTQLAAVAIRNSNHPETVLLFTTPEWDAFVGGVGDGEFDLED